MTVIGYARVSTDRQAEQGFGLEVQERQLRTWARQRQQRLVTVLSDQGTSGRDGLEGRAGLAEALRLIRCGGAQGLVISRLDRLARDLILQEQLLAEVRRSGARVFSCADGEDAVLADDPSDPSRRLIRQVLGAVAEYDRSMITLRLQAGRARKAETGYAYGAPPFGKRAENKALVDDADEWGTLERIRELLDDGASLRRMAVTLANEGRRPRRGKAWHPESLRRIISRFGALDGGANR